VTGGAPDALPALASEPKAVVWRGGIVAWVMPTYQLIWGGRWGVSNKHGCSGEVVISRHDHSTLETHQRGKW